MALARWARTRQPQEPLTLTAVGPRSSLFALVAAALEPEAVAALELQGSLGSLREVIEQNRSVAEMPELFCFGLLQEFDISTIAALVAPRELRLVQPSERQRQELRGLAAWYRLLGKDYQPLQP
jgi:hypothetical protein